MQKRYDFLVELLSLNFYMHPILMRDKECGHDQQR